MNKIKYIRYSILLLAIFSTVFAFWGLFSVGILSDTFGDAYTAVNSGFREKITNNLQFIDANRYRPVLFITLKAIVGLNSLLGIPFDNFILYKSVNLILYLLFAFISGYLILKISGNLISAILGELIVLVFPNNLHNLIWSAAYFEILCGVFCVLSLFYLIKYTGRNKILFLVYSNLCFILALLTKEISVPFPFICLLVVFFHYGSDTVKKLKYVFVVQFSILLLYFFAKTFLSKGIPVVSGEYFNGYFLTGSLVIVFKCVVSLLVPGDYLVLKSGLLNFDAGVLLSVIPALLIPLYYIFVFIKTGKIKNILIILSVFLISISPYIYAGYIRPQLILLPFTFTVIVILLAVDINDALLKYFLIIFMTLWITSGYGIINNWKTASVRGKERLESLMNIEIPEGKKCLVIGNPSRLQQSFMFDNLMFPFNYFKYRGFVLKDTIDDKIRIVALDKNSLDAPVTAKSTGSKEYEFTCTGENSFFVFDGVSNESKGLINADLSAVCLEFNRLGKPVKIKVKLLSDNLICYFLNGNKPELLK